MAEVETEAETSPLLTQPATKSADIPASVSASARLSVPTDAAIHAEGETAIGRRDSGVTETTMSAAMQPAQARPPSARSRFGTPQILKWQHARAYLTNYLSFCVITLSDDEDFSMFRLLDTPQAEREVRDEKVTSTLNCTVFEAYISRLTPSWRKLTGMLANLSTTLNKTVSHSLSITVLTVCAHLRPELAAVEDTAVVLDAIDLEDIKAQVI